MAIYNQGTLVGIVGYKQLYPKGEMYPLENRAMGTGECLAGICGTPLSVC